MHLLRVYVGMSADKLDEKYVQMQIIYHSIVIWTYP